MEKSDRARELFKSVITSKMALLEYITNASAAAKNNNEATEHDQASEIPLLPRIHAIQLFGEGEPMNEEHRLAVCDVINRKLETIKVIRDKGEHDSWLCLKYTQAPSKESARLESFSPCPTYRPRTLASSAKIEIASLFKQIKANDFEPIQVLREGKGCAKAVHKGDEFAYALAMALCLAMDQQANAFEIGLGADGDTTYIRRKIADILRADSLPTPDPEADVWQPPQN